MWRIRRMTRSERDERAARIESVSPEGRPGDARLGPWQSSEKGVQYDGERKGAAGAR
jgi:hypothetical protein